MCSSRTRYSHVQGTGGLSPVLEAAWGFVPVSARRVWAKSVLPRLGYSRLPPGILAPQPSCRVRVQAQGRDQEGARQASAARHGGEEAAVTPASHRLSAAAPWQVLRESCPLTSANPRTARRKDKAAVAFGS